MSIANVFAVLFIAGLILFVVWGIWLPLLISSASWFGVALGVFTGFLTIYVALVIIQRIVRKVTNKSVNQ